MYNLGHACHQCHFSFLQAPLPSGTKHAHNQCSCAAQHLLTTLKACLQVNAPLARKVAPLWGVGEHCARCVYTVFALAVPCVPSCERRHDLRTCHTAVSATVSCRSASAERSHRVQAVSDGKTAVSRTFPLRSAANPLDGSPSN